MTDVGHTKNNDASGDHGSGGGSVPRELRYVAVAVGLLLLLAGVVAMAMENRLFTAGALFLCVGFGITLAVFGANAKGAFMNLNVVGGGALAVALYLLIYNYPMPLAEAYARGRIENSAEMSGVAGTARQKFLVGRPQRTADYQFVIFEREVESPYIKFLFQTGSGADGAEFYISCIDSALVRSAMHGNEELVLSLEKDGEIYRLVDNRSGRQVGTPNRPICDEPGSPRPADSPVGWLDVLSMAAYAKDEAPALAELFASLESDDPAEREAARVELSELEDPAAVAAIAQSWDVRRSSYRADLGRLVAWSGLIERDRALAVVITTSLSVDQLGYLARLTGQGDITLRRYATEVFHRLLETTSWSGGPSQQREQELVDAVAAVLQSRIPAASGKSGVAYSRDTNVYNMVVAVWFAECNLGKTARAGILAALRDLDRRIAPGDLPKTRAKLRETTERLQSCT